MARKTPLWTEKNFSEEKQKIIQSAAQRSQNPQDMNFAPATSGLLHTEVTEPTINFNAAPNQLEINSQDASIIFGSDRPGGLTTGYGARGAQGSNTIDMVVGRMSSANGGAGPVDGDVVEPSFGADAARIYISQRTDIDTNFGLPEGNIGSIKGHSGIGIKADGVRLIGREGIKIVTGKSAAFGGFGPNGETNAIGGTLEIAPPIELIAGNNTELIEYRATPWQEAQSIKRLQGVSKGENTRDALKELGDLLEEVIGAMFNLSLIQCRFNSVAGLTYPVVNPAIGAAAASAGSGYMNKVINSLWQTRINKIVWDTHHLKPTGHKYVCSRNVFST
jgi:hypothetical protein